MAQTIDFTKELLQLIKFTGQTATAIRMYSAYNSDGYSSGHFGSKRSDPARSPLDLMFLADALHHFERLGDALESCDHDRIISTCDDLLTIYNNYEKDNPRFGDRQSRPTFQLWAGLVNLSEVRQALSGIRGKTLEVAAVQ